MTLRGAKLAALAGLDATGLSALVANSGWRRRRLLILCYHGVSLDHEHEWDPWLYVSVDQLRARLTTIRDRGYEILRLEEAIWRWQNGTLPRRAVVLTFDDGGYDFHARALPVLKEFDAPATVYLSTYYCVNQSPIFPLMCSYLLWRSETPALETREVVAGPLRIDASTDEGRETALDALLLYARTERLDDPAKQRLLARLARALEVDLDELRVERRLHLMNQDEVSELGAHEVDVELHTHRHRSPEDESTYRSEIRENRGLITRMTGRVPTHFCYPSGASQPRFRTWLRREGVHTATTCVQALVGPRSDRLALPRVLDHSLVTDVEFSAWLSGSGQLAARRSSEPQAA